MTFKFPGLAALLLATALPAQALTVTSMSGNDELRYTVSDSSTTTLTFDLAESAGYVNFGGYVKWSTLENGRRDGEGAYGTCYECGYYGGNWSLATYMADNKTLTLDFGETLDTVYVWVRATYGQGSVSYGSAPTIAATSAASSVAVAPVPLPAAGVLLVGALAAMGFGFGRRRSA